MLDTAGIQVIDVLYRVSTRAQEAEGESLFNQRRSVETLWAEPQGIKVRRRIEVAESGKSALRLDGAGFKFSRRAEYTELIVEYQHMSAGERPDAICVDWVDRWSRNVLEYSGLVTAFRMLGIRLLAIGDGLDLTDPRNDLIAHIRAAVGQEQVRITRAKVSEARRSRRERGQWQGGATPDGYRTHNVDCGGLRTRTKTNLDGKIHEFRIRVCDCPQTTLQRDPIRESVIHDIWALLVSSPLSWQGMTDEINARGHRRPNGTPFRWHDLYRIGENPHYAGVMTTDRWIRDQHDGAIKRKRQLEDQKFSRDTDSILDPFIDEATFWDVYEKRFNGQARYHLRARNGSACELSGLLVCFTCGGRMVASQALSSKKNGSGRPRKAPPKRYTYLACAAARERDPRCSNRQRVRADVISRLIIEKVAQTTSLDDDQIIDALSLQRATASATVLQAEQKRLTRELSTADSIRHKLTKQMVDGVFTDAEFQAEMFAFRRDRATAETRLAEVERELASQHSRPDFDGARTTLTWLRDRWDDLTTIERAEALRLLVQSATYDPTGTTQTTHVGIVRYGPAFLEPPARQLKPRRQHSAG